MKAFLMYRNKDFDLDRELPAHHDALTQDLELETLFNAMALGDQFLFKVAQKAVLLSLRDPQEIVYRQHVLNDCLEHSSIVREIYGIAVEAIERERKIWHSSFRYPGSILHRSLEVLHVFVALLKKLRHIADEHADAFSSEGFRAFFAMLKRDLDEEYFRSVEDHLDQLVFRRGVLISAGLGKGAKGRDYVLRRPRRRRRSWKEWLALLDRSVPADTLVIADRDESGAQALSELRDRGINLAANALAQSTDHLLSFFSMLRAELGFYIGCLNLQGQLERKAEPLCVPEPLTPDRPALACRGLYDVCLSLRLQTSVVGNDVHSDGARLVMITGANQGGKTTFLRSLGLAQLMMQAGMFVAAEAFRSNVSDALFTHFKRKEDPTMKSGKLDEELNRMSAMAERITPHSLVLFNESFSATNEREGAEIAGSILRALLEAGIKVFFVTHSFELAHRLHRQGTDGALFLRAERRADGTRTFKIVEGEPLPTSYGEDLYKRVFGVGADVPSAAATS